MQFVSDNPETKDVTRVTAQPVKVLVKLSAHDKPKQTDLETEARTESKDRDLIEVDRHLTGRLVGQAYVRVDKTKLIIEFHPDAPIDHIAAIGSISSPNLDTPRVKRRSSMFPSQTAFASGSGNDTAQGKPTSFFGLKRAASTFQTTPSSTISEHPIMEDSEKQEDGSEKGNLASAPEVQPRSVTIKGKPATRIIVPLQAIYKHFVELNENKDNTILSIPITTHAIHRSARESKLPLGSLEEQGRNGKIDLIWESHTPATKKEAQALKHVLKQVI